MTHPFHPWHGRQFELFNVRHNWGEQRVMFFDEAERLRSLPVAWTSLAPADPFVVLAAGRARFHLEDLCRLAHLLTVLTEQTETAGRREPAVKEITPHVSRE